MLGGTFRSLIAGAVLALLLATNVSAGPIAEAVGKGWDAVAAKIVKVHDAAKSIKPKKLIKGIAAKHGGCCHSK